LSLKAVPYISGSEARVEINIEDLKKYIAERLKGTGIESFISSIDIRNGKIVIEIDIKFFGLDYEIQNDKVIFKVKLPEPIR